VYIVNVHPSKIDIGKIPTDHNGVKDRQNDITYADRNSRYDENITRLIGDYASFVTEMKDLLEEAICKVNDKNDIDVLKRKLNNILVTKTSEQISIPVTSLIYSTEIRFIQSNVKEIRAGEHKVILDGSIIDYDLVVICLGSTTKYFGIKGAMTNTFPFRSVDDATLFHSKIQSFSLSQRSYIKDKMKKNDDDKKGSNGGNNIIIVGGGSNWSKSRRGDC
jgi:NADH dehydrogenase FAD-containing subunit